MRLEGLSPAAAVDKLLWLVSETRGLRLTGIGLKEAHDSAIAGSDTPPPFVRGDRGESGAHPLAPKAPLCKRKGPGAVPACIGRLIAVSSAQTDPGRTDMQSAPIRAILGFVAAAISVLTFHQAMWAVFYAAGQMPLAPYPTHPVPPLGVPLIVDLCFWGGLYGLVFGLLRPYFTWPLWACGLIMGIIAALVGMFIVAPIKGMPVANGWMILPIVRSLLINGSWGLGVGLILPLLAPRRARYA
jgi:hypothetical protein